MADIERLQRRLTRERTARKEAEHLLETKSSELFIANKYLTEARDELEERVRERTQALKESEESFRRFIEGATDIIYQTNRGGYFTYANPVAINKLSLSDEKEIVGHNFLELVQPCDRDRLSKFYNQQFVNQEANTYLEFQLNTPNDQVVWIGQNVQLVWDGDELQGFQAVARDITERKQMEDALQEQRDFAQQILTNMGQGLTLTDDDNNAVYVNPAYARMLGCTPEEAIKIPPSELIHPDDKERIDQTHQENQAAGILNYEVEARLIARDGQEVPVSLTRTIRMSEGQSSGAIVVISDLTEQKRMEQSLRDSRDQAINASRMKSEFLANMSHEIRTPLNGVIGMADLLQETELNDEQEEFVEIINSSGIALLSIINDILDFSKISEGKIELEYKSFHLREMIEESLDLLASKAANKGLELACMMSHHLPSHIIGDVVRVRQILINLLSNAVKFTEEGEVVVSVGKQLSEDGRNLLHVSVRDTGIGIPEEALARLFQSFSQVDASTTRNYGGSGLGLAISKELSELMGGSTWVDSVPGEGSTFHFTIDLVTSPDYIPVEPKPLAKLEGKRLLIVDDNETNRKILVHQSRLWGMLPEAASSGEEALRWLEEKQAYDLAILDMQMPEMDGCMLASKIRNQSSYPELPLIMLSSIGNKLPPADQQMFSAQASKPVKVGVLRQVVETVCKNHVSRKAKKSQSNKKKVSHENSGDSPVRILLTEDNIANQKVALGSLRRLGYPADLATNGREAVEAISRRHYDIILMDIQMPEMDGIEATQQIRKRCAETKQPYIIAMTANAIKGDRERFLAAGMDDYISKPIRLHLLGDLLKPLMTEGEKVGEKGEGQEEAAV